MEAAALATGSGEGEERRRPKEKSGDDFCAAFALEATVLLGADARRDAEDAEQRDTVRAAAAGEARGASGGLDVVVVTADAADADADSEEERADDACIVDSLLESSRSLRTLRTSGGT